MTDLEHARPSPRGAGTASLVLPVLALVLVLAAAGVAWLAAPRAGRDGGVRDAAEAGPAAAGAARPTVRIAYGTEKRAWLEWAVREFAATPAGRRCAIELLPMGSVEGAREVVHGPGRRPIHVWSPASSAWRDVFEQEWRQAHGGTPILRSANLALTPMVFVTWKERYDAFVQAHPSLTFATIAAAARDPGGWDAIAGRAEWGAFKFGHTHPARSNSGLLTLVLMAYDHAQASRDLGVADVTGSGFAAWLRDFETVVVKPTGESSDSTGTLMREMVLRGPSQYDAVMVYENLAIDHLKAAQGRWGELHVAYPERTVWNENPYYVLDVPWSGAAERRGATEFLDFLLSERVQLQALEHGFRPGNPAVAIAAADSPFTKYGRFGLRADVPPACEPPRAAVLTSLLQSFPRRR